MVNFVGCRPAEGLSLPSPMLSQPWGVANALLPGLRQRFQVVVLPNPTAPPTPLPVPGIGGKAQFLENHLVLAFGSIEMKFPQALNFSF